MKPQARLKDLQGNPVIIGYEIERDGQVWYCMGYTLKGIVSFARGGVASFEASATDSGFTFS